MMKIHHKITALTGFMHLSLVLSLVLCLLLSTGSAWALTFINPDIQKSKLDSIATTLNLMLTSTQSRANTTVAIMQHPSSNTVFVVGTNSVDLPGTIRNNHATIRTLLVAEGFPAATDIVFVSGTSAAWQITSQGAYNTHRVSLPGRRSDFSYTGDNTPNHYYLHAEMSLLSFLARSVPAGVNVNFAPIDEDFDRGDVVMGVDREYCLRCHRYLRVNGYFLPTTEFNTPNGFDYSFVQPQVRPQWCLPNFERNAEQTFSTWANWHVAEAWYYLDGTHPTTGASDTFLYAPTSTSNATVIDKNVPLAPNFIGAGNGNYFDDIDN